MEWTQKDIDDCIEQCRQKAAVDAKFRSLLLSNVNKAVREISGKDMPNGFNIKIVDSDPNYSATFVLPPLLSGNISDEELDEIAAGTAVCAFDVCAIKGCAAEK